MIVYKNYLSYNVQNLEVNIIAHTCDGGLNTVAEIGDKYYYLGNQSPNILLAIIAWEFHSGKQLSQQEIDNCLIENKCVENVLDTK